MDRRSIVLKSISCQGVKSFTFFQKPSVYAIVSIVIGSVGRRELKQQQQKTSADLEGGENPEWDHTIQFDLDDREFQDLFMKFEIIAQGNLILGDKLIGKSRVPITDLTAGHPSGALRHVSYQVQSAEDKSNGVLSFSYRLNHPGMEICISPPLDPAITPAPQLDYYPPPSAVSLPTPAPKEGLYPPLPLPEAAPKDCFCHHNQQQLPDPAKYYSPPPEPAKYYPPLPDPATYYPPLPAVGYYPSFERASYSPVLIRDAGHFSSSVSANGSYYTPFQMPVIGTYYPTSSGYTYPPPQDSCGYWNCK